MQNELSDSDDSDADMGEGAEKRSRQLNTPKVDPTAAATAAAADDVSALPLVLQLCYQVLKGLMRRREAQAAFNEPVDPVDRDIPHYHLVVKSPMDLGTIKDRLLSGYYNPDSAVTATDDGEPNQAAARYLTR